MAVVAAAILWYKVHVPRRIMPMVAAFPLLASLAAGSSVFMPITGTEFPLRLITPAIVAALVGAVFAEPASSIARTCPYPQAWFRLMWSSWVVLLVMLLHIPFAFALDFPAGVVVIRDSLLNLGLVLLVTAHGSVLFAWSVPIGYTSLVAFNAKMLRGADLVDTVGVPLAGVASIPAWLVAVGVACAGLASYAMFGSRERVASDSVHGA